MADVTKTVQQQVGETVTIMTDNMGTLLKQLTDQQQLANADADQRIKRMGETFNQAIIRLDGILKEVGTINTDTRQAMEQVGQLVDGLQRATAGLTGLAAPISAAAERFAKTGERLEVCVETVDANTETLADSVDRLVQSHGKIQEAWADYQHRFEGIDKDLGHAFEQLDAGVQRYTAQINEFVAGLDQHTADIAGKLGGAVLEFTEAIETLSDTWSSRRPSR